MMSAVPKLQKVKLQKVKVAHAISSEAVALEQGQDVFHLLYALGPSKYGTRVGVAISQAFAVCCRNYAAV